MSFKTETHIEKVLRPWLTLVLAAAIATISGCSAARQAAAPPPVQQFGHVILVVEENHSYPDVIGNSAMPYLNSLASTYGLATQYYANVHPSISNYFMLTTGQFISLDNAYGGTVNADNIVRELTAAGKTWKCYAESLPQPGYLGGDAYPYLKHHNPFAYFSDVTQQPAQTANLVPFTQFAADLKAGQLPNFSFVVPNVLDDGHDGSLSSADTWLQQNVGPVISSSVFQNDGLLIITFDEGDLGDVEHGGGHVATVVVSPKAKKNDKSNALHQHQSTLRLILRSLGISQLPGAAATASDMNEFFQ